jgi:hypothetical protein
LQVTSGARQEKRPDLQPFVLSTLGVDRAVPRWGKPEEGKASDQALKTTRWSEMAPLLARDGGQPGASSDRADAALVTEGHLATLRPTWLITR